MPDLVEQFDRLGVVPVAVHAFTNDLPVITDGGHIQGVQCVPGGFVISASSSAHAWLASLSGDSNRVTQIQRLLDKPMKHAGGFQVAGALLAVGIEDNEARTYSRVHLYAWREQAHIGPPIVMIERRGARERATAGAVAIAAWGNGHLLVVGDWDSRHLDVYRVGSGDPAAAEQIHSITAAHLPRAGWSDDAWHTYQNLNLFEAGENRFYLIGTTARDRHRGVVDLFEMQLADGAVGLRKLASRDLEATAGTSLAWGGGACLTDGRLSVFATGRTLEAHNVIVEYSARGQ